MEGTIRKPFQGVINIVRFNWHFYVLALVLFCILFAVIFFVSRPVGAVILGILLILVTGTGLSLVVSWYIYDHSNLYKLDWLDRIVILPGSNVANIHAGFDETSELLVANYPGIQLSVFDFYDPVKHTEIAITRARKAYQAYPDTKIIDTADRFFIKGPIDYIFAILAAHEIRDHKERIIFFRTLKKSLRPGGKIIVVEHLRNLPNFIAYNFGFFHFFSRQEWKKTFDGAGLSIESETMITPFVCAFIVQ